MRRNVWVGRLLIAGLALGLVAGCGGDEEGAASDGAAEALTALNAEPSDAALESGSNADAAVSAELPEAGRIVFEPGTEGGIVQGELSGGGDTARYVLQAEAGQTLRLRLRGVSNGAISLRVVNDQGDTLAAGADAEDQDLNGLAWLDLPETGDYTIDLTAVDGAPTLSYELEIRVTDAGDATAVEPVEAPDAAGETDASAGELADEGAAEDLGGSGDAAADPATEAGSVATQLYFTPGERSTTVQGSLGAGGQARYRMTAAGGQVLSLSLAADDPGLFQLFIEDPSGRVLASGLEGDGLSAELPQQQDYIVTVIAQPAAPESIYTLTIAID
ncbi:MAG: hypothetical protein KDH92_09195 [Chloroflexi bacterium]|nr:hypothetical protein [Chloroflexota bacterium]